jgi:crotonobetainyl-CoA:carnitine CoA-transferase CaiB-like acyl-CoA transferase
MAKPLEGIRVLDLTHMLSGPFAAMMLTDMGTETIKVEPLRGESTRRWLENDPEFSIEGMSVYFMTLNRNKQSMALDLKSPQGLEVFHDLVRCSDVVISNFAPGVCERLGIDYPSLKQLNPRIINCAISGYGSDGPDYRRTSFDLVAQAASGMMSVTGTDKDHPVRTGTPMGDIGAGMFAASGIMAALLERERSGEGQHVDISMLDCQVSMLSYLVSMVGFSGRDPEPMGNAHSVHVPYNTFRASDGHIVIAVLTDEFWQALRRVLQCEALDRPEFDSQPGRNAHREYIEEHINRTLAGNRCDYWLEKLAGERVPSGPVNRLSQALADPQLLHRNMLIDLVHPNGEQRKGPGNPVKMSRTGEESFGASPLLGQHTLAVLRDLLGYQPERISSLERSGTILIP